jgi:hypothetical protein
MTPVQSLQALAKANPQAATLLMAGIGGFAAVAIVTSFGLNLQSSIQPVIFVAGIGVMVLVLTAIVNNELIMFVLQWFVAIMAMIWCAAFVASQAFPENERLRCAALFWISCAKNADILAAAASRSLPPVEPAKPLPEDSAIVPGNYQVFVQFAGILSRDNVREMMQSLAAEGWKVQGVEGGGQRTATAAGYNEIRYSSGADATAAKALAASIQSTNIVASKITTARVQQVEPGTLEVYISR